MREEKGNGAKGANGAEKNYWDGAADEEYLREWLEEEEREHRMADGIAAGIFILMALIALLLWWPHF